MTGQAYRLKDICSIKSGKRIPLGMDFTTEITNYPYIRARDIKGGKIQTDDLIYIDEIVFNKIKKYIIKSGDIAITIVGASVGDVAYAQEEIDGFNLTENAVRLTEFNSVVDGKYLFYVLNQEQYHEYMQTVAGGAAQPKLGIYKVERIKVFLPPLNLQKEIASVLAAYDNLIENNNKRIRLLEQMAENLYKEWFVRFRFPGHEKVGFENGLPKGWKREKIGKVYNTCSGGTPSRVNEDFYNNGSIPWVKTGELQDCLIHDAEEFITEDALKRSSAKLLPNHSLLMAMYGVNIGKLGILRKEMTCNQAVCAFLPKTADQTFYYLYFYLKGIRNYLLSISFGAAQQNLSQALIKNVRIMIPHNDTLQKFENKVSCYFDQISIYQRQNEQLARQRDLLLPRLMSGKLEVNI